MDVPLRNTGREGVSQQTAIHTDLIKPIYLPLRCLFIRTWGRGDWWMGRAKHTQASTQGRRNYPTFLWGFIHHKFWGEEQTPSTFPFGLSFWYFYPLICTVFKLGWYGLGKAWAGLSSHSVIKALQRRRRASERDIPIPVIALPNCPSFLVLSPSFFPPSFLARSFFRSAKFSHPPSSLPAGWLRVAHTRSPS